MPKVMQLLGGAELVPNPLLVEREWLGLRRFAGGCKRTLGHGVQVSERLRVRLSIQPDFAESGDF
jgi:hypothetical protein